MRYLDGDELNNRAEEVFRKDLPKGTKVLNGQGVLIKSADDKIPEWAILDPTEEMVKLKRCRPTRMSFEKAKITVDDLKTMTDYLSGQLAYDVYLKKLIQEDIDGVTLNITRSTPRTVFEDVLHKEDTHSWFSVEVLVTFERS